MGQTCQDDTRTELSRPGEPGLMTRMVEKDIQQQHHMRLSKMSAENSHTFLVISANIEGLTTVKASLLSEIFTVCTVCASKKYMWSKVPGMTLIE